jgi:hypothetical protein
VLPAQILLSVSKLNPVDSSGNPPAPALELRNRQQARWKRIGVKVLVVDVRARGFATASQLRSSGLLASFPLVLLSQANSGTPAVLVDKLNPGSFKRTSHRQVVGDGHGSFILRTLSALDCRSAQRGFTGKVFGAPSKETAGRPNLSARERS